MKHPRNLGIALSVCFSSLAVFQLALALGAPLGLFAWGGQGGAGVLPADLRTASAAATALLLIFAGVILVRVEVISLPAIQRVVRVITWLIMAQLVLNTAANLASPSGPERYLMSPITLLMAVMTFFVARQRPQ